MSDTKTIFGMLVFVIFIGVAFSMVATLYVKMGVESGLSGFEEYADVVEKGPPEPSGNWFWDAVTYPVALAGYMSDMLFRMPQISWIFLGIFIPIIVAILIKLVRG